MFALYVKTWDNDFVERVTKKQKGGIIMIKTTTEKMLKNIDLKTGIINIIKDSVLSWNNQNTQGKLETNINNVIERTINSNMIEYFNDSQIYFITNNFESSKDVLDSFYNANPEIDIVLNEILDNGITPIKLILDGKKVDKPLSYYTDKLNRSLNTLISLKK